MTTTDPSRIPAAAPDVEFTSEQKEYLQGFLAGLAGFTPYVGLTADGRITATPATGQSNLAEPGEETIHGFPLSEVTRQELWKRELHGLDAWDRLLQHAEANKSPNEADTFRFRYHGLFYVAPAQNSFMLRCRIPAGELTAAQLKGLADIADEFGNGKAAVTTRSNIQIRGIASRNLANVLTRLQSLGLTSRGSGVDNVRNITASPTAGIDPQELLDVRPFAHALHHYILNQRDLYDLPRKFNVAFEGGGAIDTVADTNDIGFTAVFVRRSSLQAGTARGEELTGTSLGDDSPVRIDEGVYFRVELGGVTGHKQFARDCGILVKPAETVAVAAAMIRVFSENGNRTDRKKARLKYLLDGWGAERFLAEAQRKLTFPLVRFPMERCQRRPPAVRHGHIGVYRQKQPHRNYIGVAVPVGVMTMHQMRRVADVAANYGSGQLRLTPWQNLLILDVADGFVETVKRSLVRIGLHYEATSVAGGLIACTGNTGCKWAATDTKGQAVALARYLEKRMALDQPINIHLTGCPNSCAQHYIGDIGLLATKVKVSGETVEGYHVFVGGGFADRKAIGRQVFQGISFNQLKPTLEKMLAAYLRHRKNGETFQEFTQRHDLNSLQTIFSDGE